MLNNTTVSKLHEMKLGVMAGAFQKQMADQAFADISFEERFGLMVDAEWASRKNNRLTRLIRAADYAFPAACLEDIEYHADRQLDKTLITRLGTCNYLQENRNVLILGATGSGKTYLANALGMTASRSFYTVRYVRLPDLFNELAIARAEGTFRKVMKAYRQTRLLISMSGCSIRSKTVRPATCSKSPRYGTRRPPPSSAPSSTSADGTKRLANPPWPTPSVTALSTIPTPSLFKERAPCASVRVSRRMKRRSLFPDTPVNLPR